MPKDSGKAGAPPFVETQLVDGLRAGDPASYETLLRVYGPRLLAVARRFVRNEPDAQEVLQDAFVQVFRNIAAFAGNAQLGSWLHRIVVNTALMKLRSRRRVPKVSIEDLLPTFQPDGHRIAEPAWQASTDELLERAETRRIVRDCIDQLPDDYRTVLLLRDIEEMSTDEAASALGLTESALKTRLHRARQALRTLLERQFAAHRI
jgi:RNA polymerase sigma-70 factor, ECF subfamily